MVRLVIKCLFLFFFFLQASSVNAAFRLGKDGPKVNGFFELAFAPRIGKDTTKHDDYNMAEARLQLKTNLYPEFNDFLIDLRPEISFRGDFILDQYFSLKTDFDLRELSLTVSPKRWMDLKIGRQILTWGTGEYLFVNDLFSKDYVSFYIGRSDDYLKNPNDGVRVSLYSKKANLDLVIIPFFEPNKIFTGDRLSFFDSFRGGIVARDSERILTEPDIQTKNSEIAARIYRNFGSFESAIYLFRGFCKMPRGYLNELNRELFYPRLDAYGASIRGPVFEGIGNVEFGFYNSRQDSNGDNRLIENSKVKTLFGYTRDLGNDLNIGIQYLFEQTLKYKEYRNSLLAQDFVWDEHKHLVAFRATKLFKAQTLRANFFVFYSPNEEDVYLRPNLDYDFSDQLKISLGLNLAWGRDYYTEFGQMERNKNIYMRLKYSF